MRFNKLVPSLAGEFGALRVFAVFSSEKTRKAPEVVLAADAIASETVTVGEMGRYGGSTTVPNLGVENKGDMPVLFLAGELLKGGGQNRVVNSTTLVAARTKASIPVSCVESNRWETTTARGFNAGDSMASVSLQSIIEKSKGAGHRSDQSTVWQVVGQTLTELGAGNETHSFLQAQTTRSGDVEEYVSNVEIPVSAIGVAVAIGAKIVSVQIFGSAGLCKKTWRRIVRGCAIDALRSAATQCTVTADQVTALFTAADRATWAPVQAAGAGREERSTFEGSNASSLSIDDSVLHASVVCGA